MAYNTLSDAKKRREYDSVSAEDEPLPKKCEPQHFYDTFGKAVLGLSRWSVLKPVPQLGTEKTPMKEVEEFYNWREALLGSRAPSLLPDLCTPLEISRVSRMYLKTTSPLLL